jgi:hypothetical protein
MLPYGGKTVHISALACFRFPQFKATSYTFHPLPGHQLKTEKRNSSSDYMSREKYAYPSSLYEVFTKTEQASHV